MLHVLSIKLRYKLYFPFSIPTPGFPHFYYMLGANLGLLLYGEVSVMSAEFCLFWAERAIRMPRFDSLKYITGKPHTISYFSERTLSRF